jgi:hypothetical protein
MVNVNSDISGEEYVILVTTGKGVYNLDILNVLFLPKFSTYRFRYRLPHLSDELGERLRKNPHSLDGKYALIVLYPPGKETLALRKVEIRQVVNTAGFIYVNFRNHEFFDCLTSQKPSDNPSISRLYSSVTNMVNLEKTYIYLSHLSSSEVNAAFSSETDEEKNWSAMINRLSEIDDFERVVYLKLRRLLDSNSEEVKIKREDGAFSIRGSNTYELEIVQAIPEKSKDRAIVDKGVTVTASAAESHIKFISNQAIILGSYDILKIAFRTTKRTRKTKSFITLSPNRSQLQQALQDNTKVPTGMAEPKIDLALHVSREIFWILPIIAAGLFLAAFGGSYAGRDFNSTTALLGGLLSAGGVLLSAYLGLRFLSEE